MKLLESRVGSDSASTFAFDAGSVYRPAGSRLSLGLSVLNVGRGLRFLDQVDPLPLTVSGGIAYRAAGVLRVAFDVRHEPYDRRTTAAVGTEYSLWRGLALRAGYSRARGARAARGDSSILTGLGAGLGIRFGRYRTDYTFTPFGPFGGTQRISLGVRL